MAHIAQRRWLLYILISSGLVYVFYNLNFPAVQDPSSQSVPVDVPSTGTGASERPLPKKFDWSSRRETFPVWRYQRLPSGRPKSLPTVQFAFPKEDEAAASVRKTRQADVKKVFERCWKTYKEHAWLQDELDPINGGSKNPFGGWAATLIDALDTLWIMDMKAEFENAVSAIILVDFSTSLLETINVFETTIRHLGGLLGAFDLSGDERLLKKAVEVAEMLYVAFDTPERMPITRWKPAKAFSNKPQLADMAVIVAEIGSLNLEFTRLSQVTGDPKYYDAVTRVMEVFQKQQSKTKLPGMWPIVVNAEGLDFTGDNHFTLGGMSDSLYEYFPKTYALLGGLAPLYQDLYEGSMAAAIKHLIFKPMTPDDADILIAGSAQTDRIGQVTLDPEWQHLACFAGGMFALGGRLFENPEHVSIGQKLTDGCIWTYKAFPFGIMPEISHMIPCERPAKCDWDESTWKAEVQKSLVLESQETIDVHIAHERLQPGFTKIDDRRYILRPEAIESVFVLYRVTGERALQTAAWDMFTAIRKYTQTDLANAALLDVTVKEGVPQKLNSMESFWMAETLKYFYLIFSEPDLVSLDDYVLNTEAHPFKIPK